MACAGSLTITFDPMHVRSKVIFELNKFLGHQAAGAGQATNK